MSLSKILFSFKGRINRAPSWGYGIGAWFVFMVGIGFFSYMFSELTMAIYLLFGILYIAYLWVWVALYIKRLHDLNKSGWMALLLLVPFANIYLFIICGFFKGTKGENRFGPDPLESGSSEKKDESKTEKVNESKIEL